MEVILSVGYILWDAEGSPLSSFAFALLGSQRFQWLIKISFKLILIKLIKISFNFSTLDPSTK